MEAICIVMSLVVDNLTVLLGGGMFGGEESDHSRGTIDINTTFCMALLSTRSYTKHPDGYQELRGLEELGEDPR